MISIDIPPSELHSRDAVINFYRILQAWDSNKSTPNDDDKLYLYEHSKNSKLIAKKVAIYFRHWMNDIETKMDRIDPIHRLNLAVLLRVSGNLEESLIISDFINEPQSKFPCSQHTRAMICCNRAATFLDKFEKETYSH